MDIGRVAELTDVVVYIEALEQRILGHVLQRVEVRGPFLLRTATPPIEAAHGRRVTALRRVGKRIAIGLDTVLWLVFHLMIAGRLHWSQARKTPHRQRTPTPLHSDSGPL